MTTAQPFDAARAPLLRSPSTSTLGPASSQSSVRHGSAASTRRRKARFLRSLSFVAAILTSLGAGSITVFSLYGPRFQSQLHFSQFEINGIASAMSFSLYLLVPVIGYMCDRVGPSPLALLSVFLLGSGYALAAGLYRKGDGARDNRGLVPWMVLAFVCIGIGTSCMYLAAITTCAKNFGKAKHRGLLLAAPIASFGLSGMLISQIGSQLLYTRMPDGSRGEVNVFNFFIFLAVTLVVVGLFGTFALRVVGEEDLIDEAVEELERSGYLENSDIMRRPRSERSYGAVDHSNRDYDDAAASDSEGEEDADWKKTWLLNSETRRFLGDSTMWWFALGFWLVVGPGEAFINNLGTIIGTLYSPGAHDGVTSAATHVSIVAATSTIARLASGSISDLLSPSPQGAHYQTGVDSALPRLRRKLSVSRVTLFIAASAALSVGTLVLASGAVQGHGDRFWIVSGFIGTGYGAVFSLMPMIVTMIWGAENFGTNFGIVAVFPAFGATMWGLIYSAFYQAGARDSHPSLRKGVNVENDVFCYGTQCYATTFWAMTVSAWVGCGMILWAWKGRGGWARRGIVI